MKSKSSILVATTKIIHTLYFHNLFVFKVFESEHNHLVQYTYPDNMFAVKHSSLFFVMHNHCSVHVVIMNF